MKPCAYETIFSLSEDDLAKVYPRGAVETDDKRWRPAREGERPTKTLSGLLRDKRARTRKVRLLAVGAPRQRLKWDPSERSWVPREEREWGPGEEHGYTSEPFRALRNEPEVVDEETQAWITTKAHENYREHHRAALEERELRSALNQLKQLCIERQRLGLSSTAAIRAAIEALRG